MDDCHSNILVDYLNMREERFKEMLMSVIGDKIAEVNEALDAALGRVQEDVAALNAEVADLKKKVAEGVATPEELASLDTLRQRIEALDPTSPNVLP